MTNFEFQLTGSLEKVLAKREPSPLPDKAVLTGQLQI